MTREMRRVGVLGLSVLLAISFFTLNANAAREARKVNVTITPDKEEYVVDETATFDIEIKRRGRYARLKIEQIEATFPDEATHVSLTQVDRGRYTYTTPEFTEPGDFTLSVTVRTWGAVRSVQRLERTIEIFERRIEYWESIKERVRRERTKKLIDRIIAIYQRIIERIQATIDRISQRGIIGHNSCTIKVIEPVTKYIEEMEGSYDNQDREGLINAVLTLRDFDKDATPVLVDAFQDKEKDLVLRKMVAEIMGEIGDPTSVDPLINVMEDKTEENYLRAEAALTLGKIRDEKALVPLISALDDEDGEVRSSAALSLGLLGNSDALIPLMEKLSGEGFIMRIRVIGALGMLGDPSAAEPLISLLDDENKLIASAATTSLGLLEDPRAVEPLLNILQTKKDLRQANAIKALGQIGDIRAVDPLVSFLEKDDEYQVMNAGMALAQIGDPRAITPIAEAIERVKFRLAKLRLKEAYKTLTGEDYPE